jgi:hypothetical protein
MLVGFELQGLPFRHPMSGWDYTQFPAFGSGFPGVILGVEAILNVLLAADQTRKLGPG